MTPERIGYYNPNEYPVSWSRTVAGRSHGLANLEPGQPVTDAQGFLVSNDPELDVLVAKQLLAYATTAMPNFAEWNNIRQKQLGTRVTKIGTDSQPVQPSQLSQHTKDVAQQRKAPQEEVPVATVSSKSGVTEGEAPTNLKMAIPNEVEHLPEGGYRYQGMTFDSEEAVLTFLAFQRGS